jgi:hypothetical protein
MRHLTILFVLLVMVIGQAFAGEPEVPVMMRAQEDLDTCALGRVVGLNPAGDNFLAVRAGPGKGFAMLDELHSDDQVWMFEERDGWIGIVYGSDAVECSPISADAPYDGSGATGWVWGRYIEVIAG